MAAVMREAVMLDEEQCKAQKEYISRIEAENHGLRQLLMITNSSFGAHLKYDPDSEQTPAQPASTPSEEKSVEDQAEVESSDDDESQPSTKSISSTTLSANSHHNNNCSDERYSDDEEEDDDTDTICNDFPLS